jgi:soluble lytic murein transglycosylase-like protein
MNSKVRFYLPMATFALLLTAGPAQAEIVVLASGATLAVKSHRLDGDRIVLQMRNGGEVTCDKTLIEKILADEVPYPEPEQAVSPSVAPAADDLSAITTGPYGEIIMTLAQAHGVDPMLVRALIQVESNYRPTARSRKGAMGLMQLMPSTARQYNVRNPYDPKANVSAGVKHLKALIDRWGVELALAAYNAGEGAVEKFNGVPPYRETRNYVSRILALAGIQ